MASARLYPIGLLAELTHRCPLGCPYCSNPVALERRESELDAPTWRRVFQEASALGVLQVHLSGGEPAARTDLVEITAAAHDAGLYCNLITSAIGMTAKRLGALAQEGLDHVQISFQDSIASSADHIAGYRGAFARKQAVPLIGELRSRHRGRIVIDAVVPDYHARYPKPCMGGWGRRSLNVTPSGKVLPCHAAETIAGLEFWNVRDHSLAEIWADSPGFKAFRGTAWMKEPCASCARRDLDFGGCRCQAFALTGDAAAADPVCHLSPAHGLVAALSTVSEDGVYSYRRM